MSQKEWGDQASSVGNTLDQLLFVNWQSSLEELTSLLLLLKFMKSIRHAFHISKIYIFMVVQLHK